MGAMEDAAAKKAAQTKPEEAPPADDADAEGHSKARMLWNAVKRWYASKGGDEEDASRKEVMDAGVRKVPALGEGVGNAIDAAAQRRALYQRRAAEAEDR